MPARERRYVLRSLFTPGSVKFWNLKTDAARLIYLAMIVNADDEGRVECGWRDIAAMAPLWRTKQNTIIGAVKDLEGVGLIRKYGVDRYGTFLGWSSRSLLPTEDPVSVASRYGFAVNSLPTRSGVATGSLQGRPMVADEKTPVCKWCCIINGFTQSQSGKEVKWENTPIPAPSGGLAIKLPKDFTYIHKKEHTSKESVPSDPESVFREAHRRFRRIVGKNLGSLGSRSGQWSGLVAKEGSEIILEAIELWAREEKKFLSETKYHRLGIFFNNSAKLIENARIERERQADPEEKSADGFVEDTTTPTVEDIRPPDYAPLKRNVG